MPTTDDRSDTGSGLASPSHLPSHCGVVQKMPHCPRLTQGEMDTKGLDDLHKVKMQTGFKLSSFALKAPRFTK